MDDSRNISTEVVNGAAPELGSLEFVSYTASSIVLKSTVVRANGYVISERGFCWSTETQPTPAQSWYIAVGEGKGEFIGTIEGLQGNTKYYFRAYAVNEKGTSYSDEDTLTTNSGLGIVRTLDVTNRRATMATGGGKIELYGEGEIVSYGIFKASSESMTNKDTIRSTNPIVADSFLCSISGLSADTKYYVQAFVTNGFGTFVGDVVDFSTGNGKPVIDSIRVLNPPIDIGYTEVTVVSGVLEEGDGTIEESGFCWSEIPHPTTESGNRVPCRFQGEIGPFVAQIDGLTPRHTYYFRAYAKNGFGTVYSNNELIITTKSQLPTLRTNSPTVNSAQGTVVAGGQIQDQGKSPIIAKGICYSSTNQAPTIDGSSVSIGVSDAFSVELSGLKGETTYYIRAYAKNSEGESYGETVTITLPQIFNGGLSPFPQMTPLEASSAYFMIGSRFYLLGGDMGPNYSNRMFSYDRSSDDWRELSADHPAFKWQAAVGYGQSAYVLGGMGEGNVASNDFYIYALPPNTWYPMPKGPDSAYLRTGVALGEYIYYFGGMKDTAKNDVWAFHVSNLAWEKKPELLQAQYGGIAVGIDSVVYVGLGKNTAGTCNKTLWKSTDKMMTWSLETDNSAISNGILAGVTFKNKIYVVDESYRIHEYDPQTFLWRTKSVLPSPMHDVQCMYALGDLIYIGFGNNSLVMYNPLWDN
ncbi:MAG: hypothetical protein LBF85_09925 [Tannerella sp.]|jgi:hypothetical protein|nr:hypothetical protein [Tannerella sp.]